MKIVKRGKPPEETTYRTTCRCGTVYEYAKKEAEYIHDQRDGDALKTTCPICKRENWRNLR